MRVLAITRKPYSASFEQRILAYRDLLEERGIEVTMRQFPQDSREQKVMLRKAGNYDVVWWHRHLLTRFLRHRLRRMARRIVYDYDDPLIFSTRKNGRSLARRWRFSGMLRIADAAMAGSQYLRTLGLRYNDNIEVVPMGIGKDQVSKPSRQFSDPVQLLWLGSKSTQKYLELIRPSLERLGTLKGRFRLKLVAHYPMEFGSLPVDYVRWSPDEQAKALANSDIGLCPMPDTPWAAGKCPYKVIQYMASGMPWVGSAVGENVAVAGDPADPGRRGLCADSDQAWGQALLDLADDPGLRIRLGEKGVRYVAEHHDREKLADQIAGVLYRVHGAPAASTSRRGGLFERLRRKAHRRRSG